MIFYQRFLGDYMKATAQLSLIQHGAYTVMLDVFYATEEPLPVDPDELFRVVRAVTADEQAAVSYVRKRFWKETKEGLINQKALTIMDQTKRRKQKQSEVQRERARKRWGKTAGSEKDEPKQQTPKAHATQQPADTSAQKSGPRQEVATKFEEFWTQYPHRGGAKKGKAKAVTAYVRALKGGATEDEIIAGALRYANDRQVLNGYAKDPATWLNQKGWMDDIEPPNPPGNGVNHPTSGSQHRRGSETARAAAALAEELEARSGNGA